MSALGVAAVDYNAAGQQTALTYPGGSGGQLGEVVSFGNDAIGQLTSVGGAGVQYLLSFCVR